MKKVYLMKGMALGVMAVAVASCSKDVGGYTVSNQQALANAELALGVEINPNQDWKMTQEVKANVTVVGDYQANYEVTIYQNNPFASEAAVVLGKDNVVSGSTASFSFVAPNKTASVFVGIKDAKGYTYVKPANIVDGTLEANFGTASTASAPRRSMTRGSAADDYTIPVRTAPDVSAYINDAVPITAENNNTNTSVRHYVIPAGTEWNDNIPLIQASDPNDMSIVTVYVLGTLNINGDQRVNGGYGGSYMFIVGNGGVINIGKDGKLESNANQGANNVTGLIHVLSGGTIQGEGKLVFNNGATGYNYNGGTIKVGTLNNNGGELYNAGTIEADYLEGGAGGSRYVNAGKVHIKAAFHGSGSANLRIINNCWWEVDDAIACRNIVQGVGAYFHSKTLEMSGSEDGSDLKTAAIWAKDNSLISVDGAVAFNNVDIIGPTGDNYAYLQFGSVGGLETAMNASGGWGNKVTAGAIQNNIRMSIDKADTDDNMYTFTPYETLVGLLNGDYANSDNPYAISETVGNGNAVLVQKGQVNDVVSESDCTPGITIVPPTPVDETYLVYSYAFEDTMLGDYDMNDVVLKVQETKDKKLNITLVASGATLDLNIRLYPAAKPQESEVAHYEGQFTNLTYNGLDEVHDMLGVERGTMVNTGSGAKAKPITIQIDKGSYDPACLPLAIYSVAQGEMRLAGSGQAPFGVIIPIDWKWPKERINITNAYNKTQSESEGDQSFATFAAEENQAEHWYNYPTSSVMDESTLGF